MRESSSGYKHKSIYNSSIILLLSVNTCTVYTPSVNRSFFFCCSSQAVDPHSHEWVLSLMSQLLTKNFCFAGWFKLPVGLVASPTPQHLCFSRVQEGPWCIPVPDSSSSSVPAAAMGKFFFSRHCWGWGGCSHTSQCSPSRRIRQMSFRTLIDHD